jgi:tripartite-type tricarboxylate transporter receptor subunit TctC
MNRRQFLKFTMASIVLAAGPLTDSRMSRAQAWPTRPVRIIVGFAGGGAQDIMARLVGQWLSDHLGESFIIENRSGANSNIGAEAVVRAPPDGYTLFLCGPPNVINATLYDKLSFNFAVDLAPVASIATAPLSLMVNPSFPVDTVPAFIAYAKSNPGRITMGSAGIGSPQHMSGELFKMMTGTTMLHVPYRGSAPSLTDLIGGQVQATFDTTPGSIEHIRAGRLRALGVTTATPSEVLPGVPTIATFVPGYEASSWYGIVAPKNTPADIVDTLNREIGAAVADTKIKARLADLGATPLALPPADFGKFIADEIRKWGNVVKFSGAKME